MIRTIDVCLISENIRDMCIEANHFLSKDMDSALKKAEKEELQSWGKRF